MNLPRVALAIPGAFLGAAIVTRLLMTHAPARVATDLAQPLAVVTDWNAFGAALLATLVLAAAIATVAYLRTIERIGSVGSPLAVAGLCALALACAWCVPVLFSSDVYAYATYGEMARLGIDPYSHVMLARGNPIFDAAIWQWGNPPPACVYGPAFVAIAQAVVVASAALGIVVQLDGLRLVASLALVLCGGLAYAAYPGSREERVAAAATIALNPIAIACAAEGHNDALALVVVLAGFALARRGAIATGAVVVALSGLVKLPGSIAAIALAAYDRRTRVAAVAGFLLALVLSRPLLVSAIEHVAPHGRYAPAASLQAIVNPIVLLAFPNDRLGSLVTWLVAVAVASPFAIRGIAQLRRNTRDGWAWLALAGWLLVPNPYPWYALWLVAVAALAPGTRIANVLLLFSLASLLRYAPDAIGAPNVFFGVALGIAATLPLMGAFAPREKQT